MSYRYSPTEYRSKCCKAPVIRREYNPWPHICTACRKELEWADRESVAKLFFIRVDEGLRPGYAAVVMGTENDGYTVRVWSEQYQSFTQAVEYHLYDSALIMVHQAGDLAKKGDWQMIVMAFVDELEAQKKAG